jgi:hypothetical protein
MMEAVCTSETPHQKNNPRHYNPQDSSEHHTRHRENLKSQIVTLAADSVSPYLPFTQFQYILLLEKYFTKAAKGMTCISVYVHHF